MEDSKSDSINGFGKSENEKGSSGRGVLDLGAAVTLLLALATAVSYLNGRAYHDGYMSYLNLSTSMFPLQGTDAAALSAVAWLNAIVAYLKGFEAWSVGTWLEVAGVLIAFVLIIGSIHHFGGGNRQKKIEKGRGDSRSWIATILRSGLAVLLGIYVFIFLLLIFAFLLATFISPFFSVGREQAEKDLRAEFKDSPIVMMTDPLGKVAQEYKIIECSTLFCALYREGKVYTVPASKVEWAVSIPDSK